MEKNLEIETRINELKSPLWIGYARAVEIREQMERLFTHPPSHRMPNMAIIGHSNNGKTMILENFLRRKKADQLRDHKPNDPPQLPVFHFQAPPEADELRLYRRMLSVLFADTAISERERVDSMIRKVGVILKNLQTRMIMMDEFGFLQAGTPAKQRRVLNSLKFLGNELRIPIVVAAVPEALNLLQSDEQIENRFEPVFLPRWKKGEDFTRLLVSMERALNLRNPSHLHQPTIAQRILDESDGIIGNMASLLQRMGEKAIRTGSEQITEEDLSPSALKKLGWTHPTLRHNFPL